MDHISGDRHDSRYANLQVLHGHCHDAKTREHGDHLPVGMRDKQWDTEERSARKRARSVLEQREVERSASRLSLAMFTGFNTLSSLACCPACSPSRGSAKIGPGEAHPQAIQGAGG